jgi:hypothetical protein
VSENVTRRNMSIHKASNISQYKQTLLIKRSGWRESYCRFSIPISK